MKTPLTPLLIVFLLVPTDAHAYLDPATGSMILQGAIAAVFGSLFTLKLYWHRVKAFLGMDSPEATAGTEKVESEPES